ncbi:hypothetical protein C9994_17240, partial [Marivirga lumbricoides]
MLRYHLWQKYFRSLLLLNLALVEKLKHKEVQVVLLDKNNFHQFQPLLYQVATSALEPDSIVFPFRKQI